MHTNSAMRAALLALGCGAAWLAATSLHAQPDPFKPLPKRTAEEWRKLFPFQALGDRLGYEAEHAKTALPPALTPEAAKALDTAERGYQPGRFGDVRRESLKKLHSDEVQDFITRDGFGLERMPRPSVRYLELAQAPTFPLGKVGYPDAALAKDPPVALPEKGPGVVGESRLPSREGLAALHTQSGFSFAMPASLGLVKDKKEAAGFDPHGFRFEPTLAGVKLLGHERDKEAAPGAERWVLRKLELVSVTKQARPAAYVSAQLPRMEDLKNAPKRDLDGFEVAAIKRLEAGEDVATDETLNRIRMVGAVRAHAACLECHTAKRGQLLGAFTYELLRDPPATK